MLVICEKAQWIVMIKNKRTPIKISVRLEIFRTVKYRLRLRYNN